MAAGVFLTLALFVVVLVLASKLSDTRSKLADIQSGRVIPGSLHNKIYQEAEGKISRDLYTNFLNALNEESVDELRKRLEYELDILNEESERKHTREELHRFLSMMGDVRAEFYKD